MRRNRAEAWLVDLARGDRYMAQIRLDGGIANEGAWAKTHAGLADWPGYGFAFGGVPSVVDGEIRVPVVIAPVHSGRWLLAVTLLRMHRDFTDGGWGLEVESVRASGPCTECNGTRVYEGVLTREPCRACQPVSS